MKEWNYDELKRDIDTRKTMTDHILLSNKTMERPVRRRARDEAERDILDFLCVKKWKDAENNGKIKYIHKNEWYYEY